jgi:hypothetical protein
MLSRRKKWSRGELNKAVKGSTSLRQVIKKLGLVQAGGNYEQVKKYISYWDIDASHFRGKAWNKGMKGIGRPLYPLGELLVQDSAYQSHKLKNRLYKEGVKIPRCELCGWAKKAPDGRLPLELDHINGDRRDNRIVNLRILCPNCHSLQPTHRGRNIRKTGPVA